MTKPLCLLTNPIDPIGHQILEPHFEVVCAPDASADTLKKMSANADAMVRTPSAPN